MPLLHAALVLGAAWRAALPRASRGLASLSIGARSPRLLLTSGGLTTLELQDSFRRMLQSSSGGEAARITMIVTAQMAPSSDSSSKRSPGELRRRRWADARKKGREVEAQLGVPVECIDFARDVDVAAAEEAVGSARCIWVTGGNTFYLWHHLRRTGLHELVRQRVLSEGVLYVGQSAGSIVAGRTIATAFWKGWDDPAAAGEEVDWEAQGSCDAMNLTPEGVSFFPHYEEPEWQPLVAEKRETLGHECVVLSDDGTRTYIRGDNEGQNQPF